MAKDHMIGQVISHYEILRKLGEGGMGVVYKAKDRKLDRHVALKFLPHYLQDDPVQKQRFLQEAKAASALDHENIGTIHEINESPDGQIFIAMACYEGESLVQKIRRAPLAIEEAMGIAIQMANGLSFAHAVGVIHRDIKPANILSNERGQIKIVDFGLAKFTGRTQLTKTGGTVGTPSYMSPEQTQGLPVDERTDIWSLAVVLYEMLTAEHPFQGDYQQVVIYRILHEDPESITKLRSEIPHELEAVVEKALNKDLKERYNSAAEFLSDLEKVPGAPKSTLAGVRAVVTPGQPVSGNPRIFLSYKRNAEPDEAVAKQIYDALQRDYDVFIDQNMSVGEQWVERIMAELQQADYLITLLSAKSLESEMVQEELKTAYHLAKQKGGRPKILPVRLDYRKAFQYPLSEYLDAINWAFWEKEEDTQRIIEEIKQGIAGGDLPLNNEKAKAGILESSQMLIVPQPFAQAQPSKPVVLESPEGTMDPESGFYIERSSDDIGLNAIQRAGVTITIKAPRQMGKSSLLIRIMQAASEAGKRIAFLDFQLFDKSALDDADIFFRQFGAFLADELELEDRTEEFWKMPLGNSQRCSRYMGRYLLKELGAPLLLAMDETETMFDTDFRSDFFGMLRNWHNSRATKPIWKQLDLALVTSTEPYQLIDNLNQSPFNVGEVIELSDFTSDQISDLNRRYGSPLSPAEEQELVALVDGHPYLSRRALYLIASQRSTARELFSQATDERGPFGDHLRYHLFRLYGKDLLIQGLREVIAQHTCADERVFFRLRGAGLVKRDQQAVLPRCKLYADYFRQHIHG